MNIVGEGFDNKIIEQINVRQEIYGSINRTNEQLTFLNSRTGWCKLVSSVNIKGNTTIRGLRGEGAILASKYVLFNGTSIETPNAIFQRTGIWPSPEETINNPSLTYNVNGLNPYAYGLGGTAFGLRPMPGIISAEIKTETRGSLKTATIRIKANNREQFDIIDLLYLRLGFSMLLEWGNSSFYNNNKTYITDNDYSLATEFLTGGIEYNNYYSKIKEKIDASCGNYDAIIGKVVNFNWTFNKDGSYDITLILRSLGDVIESLKTNALLPGKIEIKAGKTEETTDTTTENSTTPPQPTPASVIKSFAEVHNIGKEFYKLQQKLETSDTVVNNNDVIAFKQIYDGGPEQYYIRLGYFLEFIKKTILPYVKTNDVPIVKIDTDIKTNIIYLQARQISTDLRICAFKRTLVIEDKTGFDTVVNKITEQAPEKNTYTFFPQANDFIVSVPNKTKSETPKPSNNYGQIMNAYFNMEYIITQLNSLKNEEGKVTLYSLLNDCLCQGWNKSTGNFNKLEPIVDSDETIIRFIDQVSLPDRDEWLRIQNKSTALASFDVYGYYYDEKKNIYNAGFIKDISFNTTVPPNLATMITIGATAEGYVVGQDATALSRMNGGLIDRFKPQIKTQNDNNARGPKAINENYSTSLERFNTFVSTLGSYEGRVIPTWDVAAMENFTNTAITFYEYDQAKQTLQQAGLTEDQADQAALSNDFSALSKAPASPNSGFLPFDLSVTMDGLSGMKVYQKYTIDTSYLPSNYPTSLEFLIKGITNKIENNQWTTTLESLAIPKNPYGSEVGKGTIASGTVRDSSRGTNISPTFSGNTPNADALRIVLLSLGYTEKNKELSSGGDITFETYKAAASVFKAIKENLPSISIKVTGGNDSFHKTLNYNSRHKLGKGVDFIINPSTPSNITAVENILLGFSAGNTSFRFLNEYDSPTKAATAKHFHISWGAGTEGQANINKAIALANQNKITIYNIV